MAHMTMTDRMIMGIQGNLVLPDNNRVILPNE